MQSKVVEILLVEDMSGYTDDAVVRHGMLEPGLAYLEKPFRPPTLLRKVREVLRAPPSPE